MQSWAKTEKEIMLLIFVSRPNSPSPLKCAGIIYLFVCCCCCCCCCFGGAASTNGPTNIDCVCCNKVSVCTMCCWFCGRIDLTHFLVLCHAIQSQLSLHFRCMGGILISYVIIELWTGEMVFSFVGKRSFSSFVIFSFLLPTWVRACVFCLLLFVLTCSKY